MALSQSALLEVLDALKASDSTDVIRQTLQLMLQQLIDAEATAFIGAEPHERTDARVTQRNGTRSKTITTAAGDLDLSITKLRTGSFFPSLLERRRRIDQAPKPQVAAPAPTSSWQRASLAVKLSPQNVRGTAPE